MAVSSNFRRTLWSCDSTYVRWRCPINCILDTTIRVWALDALTHIYILQMFGEVYHVSVCVSHQWNCILDATTVVWSTVSYECAHNMKSHRNTVDSLCLCEYSRLYSGSGDGRDTATNTCIATLGGHYDTVTSLCLSFKTNRLISASNDGDMRMLLTLHPSRIYMIMWSKF
jgi:WD40 repeat protein